MVVAYSTVDTGQGITMTWATSAWAPEITRITPPAFDREEYDTTHLATAAPTGNNLSNQTKMLGDVIKSGDVEIEGHYNPNVSPPITNASEVVTIKFPLPSSSWKRPVMYRGTCQLKSFKPGSITDGKMTFTATIAVLGAVLKIAASTSTSST